MSCRSQRKMHTPMVLAALMGNRQGSTRQRRCLCVFIVILVSLTHLSCNQTKTKRGLSGKYLKRLDHLIGHKAVHLSGGKQDESFSHLSDHIPSLVTKKLRRFQIPAAPTMNVRDFMKIANCSIAQQIAYRNSPLGRVMLPSQTLAYQARFIKAAKSCDLEEGRLKEHLDLVISHKEKYWSQYRWNAIWSGNKIAKFFSISWPRNHSIRELDAGDEARFLWLGRLLPTMKSDFSSELEQHLSNIPNYVGGRILSRAYHTLVFLQKSSIILRKIKIDYNGLSKVETQTFCHLFQSTLNLFGQLQGKISLAYQSLVQLQKGLRPILRDQDTYPSTQMNDFVHRWLLDRTEDSVQRELKQLSKENVDLWLTLQGQAECA